MTLWEYMNYYCSVNEECAVWDDDYHEFVMGFKIPESSEMEKYKADVCLAKNVIVRRVFRSDLGNHRIVSVGFTDLIIDHFRELQAWYGEEHYDDRAILDDLVGFHEEGSSQYEEMVEIITKPKTRKSTLLDYLKTLPEGEKVAVRDSMVSGSFFIYARNGKDINKRDNLINQLANLAEVDMIHPKSASEFVFVDFCRPIYDHLYDFAQSDLYSYKTDISDIMNDLKRIFEGYVSEEWLEQFVRILKQ